MFHISFGMFFGPWGALAIEAVVEIIYPVDQAIGHAIAIAAGQICTASSIGVSTLLVDDLIPEAALIQVHLKMCTNSTFAVMWVNVASLQFCVH